MTKTFLDVSFANKDYVKSHGAKWDVVVKQFYIEGEIPVELLGFLPKKHQQSAQEKMGPACPKCGCAMIIKTRKSDGLPFWSCPTYPHCDGASHYTEKEPLQAAELAAHSIVKIIDETYVKNKKTSRESAPNNQPKEKSESAVEIQRIYNLAVKQTGNATQAERWLSTPKVALKGKTPISIINTSSGREILERLLLDLNS